MGILSIFDKIKDSFGITYSNDDKYREFVENVMPSLNFGDIIYAERFNDEF